MELGTTKAWAIVCRPTKGSVDAGGKHDKWSAQGKYWKQAHLEPWNDGHRTMIFRTRKQAREVFKEKFSTMSHIHRKCAVARVEVKTNLLRIDR